MNILPFEYLCVYQHDRNEFTSILNFREVTLTQQLGEFSVGQTFAEASIDLSTGELTFESYHTEVVYRFTVDKLVVK